MVPREQAKPIEVAVPLAATICYPLALWFMYARSWNPFANFPYPSEAFVVLMPTFGLLIPTIVSLFLFKKSFQSARLTHERFKLSALLGTISAVILLATTVVFSQRFVAGLQAASVVYVASYFYQAFCEELFFRGFLQTRLEAFFGESRGLIVTAVIFNLYHGPADIFVYGLSTNGFIKNVVLMLPFAIMLGYLALKSNSLVGSSIYHVVYNLPLILPH
jgi:membrane protease YdiL (CAAX protease family)